MESRKGIARRNRIKAREIVKATGGIRRRKMLKLKGKRTEGTRAKDRRNKERRDQQ